MIAGKKGYFLLDAVLATLILSILLTVVLSSLMVSLKALRKVNFDLIALYKGENVLIKKIILQDDFENSGYIDEEQEISYLLKTESLEEEMNRITVVVKKSDKIQARLSTYVLR